MGFPYELKNMRKKCLLSQTAFADELGVSFSTVNRWESGKSKPNFAAMKNIKAFCDSHNTEYGRLETEWLIMGGEENGN